MIYLDNAAATPLRDSAKNAMIEYMKRGDYGNPSSVHAIGKEAGKALDAARNAVKRALNAREDDFIIFTSGATESNNIVMRNDGDNVISRIEHPSIYGFAGYNENNIVNSNGTVQPEAIREIVCYRLIDLVTLMMANNETGVIQPVKEVSDICLETGTYMHTDATQSAGHIPIDVKELGVDFLSLSAHKFGGPQGVGVLYVNGNYIDHLCNLFRGGRQEYKIRPGTQNVMGAIGLAVALNESMERMAEETKAYSRMSEIFLDGIKGHGIRLNCADAKRLPNILSLTVDGVDAVALVSAMSAKGVCISGGSACHESDNEPSRVLKAMGMSDEEALSTVRVSFGWQNTEAEAEEAARILVECAEALRKI